jgi:hypothetical protein
LKGCFANYNGNIIKTNNAWQVFCFQLEPGAFQFLRRCRVIESLCVYSRFINALFSLSICPDRGVRTALVVYQPRESLQQISESDEAWNIIKGFYSGKRPETCRECTFYRPINQAWLA